MLVFHVECFSDNMAMAVEDLSFLHEMIARKYESEENVKTLYESLHGNNPLREGETIDHKIADMNRYLRFRKFLAFAFVSCRLVADW